MTTARPEDPPSDTGWRPQLHWALRVMATDDRDLGFVASLLHSAIKYDGLTEKQGEHACRVIQRLREDPTANPAAKRTTSLH